MHPTPGELLAGGLAVLLVGALVLLYLFG